MATRTSSRTLRRALRQQAITLAASAARGASGQGPATESADRSTAVLTLAVAAASGTDPTLDVTVETSEDGTTWRTAGTFAQKTGVSAERKSFPGLDQYVRASWVVGGTGTPSFTFSVVGDLK